jgi:hypothetical protein
MGKVLQIGVAPRAPRLVLPQPATVLILPVVRIDHDALDPRQGMPSDSAPSYTAPDTDLA